ncbi:hypothetical protein [Pseudomonas sp. GL-B-16]|uniref:hypothetical protein n=1 Tax=Pseudomonas sp. GL-B-16 TaxID=2832373 RepID=UPI001CC0124E|nr:hypothetical protein [Pseudomonas sp. GL-B-16]
MSNFAIPSGTGVYAATIQTVVPPKDPKELDPTKNAQGANGQSTSEVTKDDKPDGKDGLNMFSSSASTDSTGANNAPHSPLETLRKTLEDIFEKHDGGKHTDKPQQAGDGQIGLGSVPTDMPVVIPNGSKTVDHSPQVRSSHDSIASLQALLEGVLTKLGGGKPSDKPHEPGDFQLHAGSADIS